MNQPRVSLAEAVKAAVANRPGQDRSVLSAGEESVTQARHGSAVTDIVSDRTAVRVLFLTTDTSILDQHVTSLDGYLALSDIFDEVHVVVLRIGRARGDTVVRIAQNGWLYTVTAKNYWQLYLEGIKLIKRNFDFADGFRPDIIVARDMTISGFLAVSIAREHHRPVQVHITTRQFRDWKQRAGGFLVTRITGYVMRMVTSVRTDTAELVKHIQSAFPEINDVAPLPRLQPVATHGVSQSSMRLQDTYPQYAFFVVFVGDLDDRSSCYQALDAMRPILRNPRIALVVVGDGSRLGECRKRASLLGIGERVIFETHSTDAFAYIRAADMMLVTDTTSESEDVVTQAMVAGIPLIVTTTPYRKDIFSGTSAAVVLESSDIQYWSNTISRVINDNAERLQMKLALPAVVEARLHQDPNVYREQYKASIEQVLTNDVVI
jgi:glycosyltransferase involved in cell wall biosynthesis